MDEVYKKLDKISEDVTDLKVIAALNVEQLKEHMRRTDLLETRVEQVAITLKPLQSHVDMVKGALKLLTISGIILGILEGILKLWR